MTLLDRSEVLEQLQLIHGLTEEQADSVVKTATESVSGMGSLARTSRKTVWVSQLLTQNGKFIIETEWPR